jgi:hypothetical protein
MKGAKGSAMTPAEYAEQMRLKQWEVLQDERKKLLEAAENDWIFYEPMEDLWKIIEVEQEVISREGSQAGHPFEVLCSYIEDGFYPPPEHLKYLVRVLHSHIESGGQLSLDEMLLGPPVKKSGNYGRRQNTKDKWSSLAFHVANRMNETGEDALVAASFLAEKHGLTDDPDFDVENFLRQLRRTGIWRFLTAKKIPANKPV